MGLMSCGEKKALALKQLATCVIIIKINLSSVKKE